MTWEIDDQSPMFPVNFRPMANCFLSSNLLVKSLSSRHMAGLKPKQKNKADSLLKEASLPKKIIIINLFKSIKFYFLYLAILKNFEASNMAIKQI
ncbi:MAG: hypothetical protein LBP22_05050 [Deltaproteobacteria bacterium]|nr:hypothetical protein [Deltaproteobacteria bacterium]